jgi:hypothetical protein
MDPKVLTSDGSPTAHQLPLYRCTPVAFLFCSHLHCVREPSMRARRQLVHVSRSKSTKTTRGHAKPRSHSWGQNVFSASRAPLQVKDYHRRFPDNMPYEPANYEDIINAHVRSRPTVNALDSDRP